MRGLLLLRDSTDLDPNQFYLEHENVDVLAGLIQKRIGSKTFIRFKDPVEFKQQPTNSEMIDTKRGVVIIKVVGDYSSDRKDVRVMKSEVTMEIDS